VFRIGLLTGCVAVLFAGSAVATPIDYIFTGTGTGTLNGTPFSGSFTVTGGRRYFGCYRALRGRVYQCCQQRYFRRGRPDSDAHGNDKRGHRQHRCPRVHRFRSITGDRRRSDDKCGVRNLSAQNRLAVDDRRAQRRAGDIFYVGGQSGFRHHHGAKLPGGYTVCAGAGLPGAAWHGSRLVRCGSPPAQGRVSVPPNTLELHAIV
jgi:hypothetical protein